MPTEPIYLGDGAYVKPGSFVGEIILYTTNGVEVTNEIVLGPHELEILKEAFLSGKLLNLES